jgi:hypothetical protein
VNSVYASAVEMIIPSGLLFLCWVDVHVMEPGEPSA